MSELLGEEFYVVMEKIKKAPKRFGSDIEAKSFVMTCEKDFEDRFDVVLNEIANISDLKILTLSGPTCSGKTTAANKIIAELDERGRRVNVISIDDFYLDKAVLHSMSDGKEIDYDSPATIDLPLLAEFVEGIENASELSCPIFDFHSGCRTGYKKISCSPNDVFIFEGIQAIYPEVTALFEGHGYYSAYIAPQSLIELDGALIEPNELRLLRRLVRDSNFRSTDAEFTFKIWESVRKNEDKNIFPYIDDCLFYIDSSFSYEIGILKPYLERILGEISEDSEYRERADGILNIIRGVQSISKDCLPPESLYREFV